VIRRFAPAAAPVAALLLWGTAVHGTNLRRIDGLGLLSAVPATYYVSVGLLALGFLIAVSRPCPSRWVLRAHIGAMIVVLHGTTPLLYDEPRYAWVFKHFGVIDFIARHGAVDRAVDIYQNWPAFFALNAWLSRASGIQPIAYAAWSQVFFEGLFVTALLFALRAFTEDLRTLWTSAWIFVLANWVAQDYLAPQAMGFLLSIVVLGLCLRCATPMPAPRGRIARHWDAFLDRLEHRAPMTSPHVDPARPLSPAAALAVGGICYAALVATHQLSPVMVLFAAWLLALARRLPLRVPLTMAAMEAAWLSTTWPFLSKHFELIRVDPLAAVQTRPAGVPVGAALPGQALVAWMTIGTTALTGLLALAGLLRARSSGRWDRRLLPLLIAPAVAVLLQPYGGEAVFRAYLFALPWMSYLAALACAPSGRMRVRALRRWRLAMASAALGTGLLFSYFGLEMISRVPREDVAAARWLDAHAARGSSFSYLAPNFPERPTARYAEMRVPGNTFAPALSRERSLAGRRLDARDAAAVEAFVRATHGTRSYFVVSRGELNYIRLYGLFRPGSSGRLIGGIDRSPAFRLVYHRGDSRIWLLRRR
jgi:hypothetical protein